MAHLLSMVSKTSKKRLSETSIIAILVGLILFSFGFYKYYRVRVLSFSGGIENIEEIKQKDIPVQVIIPSLKIDIPIDLSEIKDGVWGISYKNAAYLASSAAPGGGGNIVIYGHNKRPIFGSLPYLSIGQKVFIKTQSGKIYVYEVYKKDFVNPDRIDLVSPTNREELTLFTCWGLFDSQRAVIKAKPSF